MTTKQKIHRRIRGIAAVAILALIGRSTAANAQTVPLLALSVEAGGSRSGSGASVESVLRVAGMDGVNPFGGSYGSGERSVRHPFSERKPAWGADARVRVTPRISIGVSTSKSNRGSTYGYRGGVHFAAGYSVRTVAPVIAWHPVQRLRIGGGPALHDLSFSSAEALVEMRKTALGWTGQAGIAMVDRKRMFSEITARYHGMGPLAVGALAVTQKTLFGVTETVTIPESKVRYQHWTVGVNVGVKFIR